jgi:hypothetical protein
MALLFARGAPAEGQRRIAVLEPDSELFRAVSLSLSAWGVETTRSDAPPPPSLQPEAVQVAANLARQLRVEAVVWVSATEGGSLLWVFDARAGEITTRMLAERPPFDSAAAASVALSVKTVLRASVVAPPEERFGAEPAQPKARLFALELGVVGTWFAEHEAQLRFELGAVAWLAAARRLGMSLELSSGPPLTIGDSTYQGRYLEHIVGAKARFRFIREPGLSAALGLGGALHWTTLEGKLVESSLERNVSRLNGSLDAQALFSVHLGGAAYLGAAADVSYLLSYQRYLVGGQPVLAPWPVGFGIGGYSGVELF